MKQSTHSLSKHLSALLDKVQRYRLRNGLTVLILPDHSRPVAAVQFWVRAGSRDEHPGITGISHFLEHMMFRGSRKYGADEHPRLVRRVGGTLNAYTSYDHTVYHELVPSNQVELMIHLEAERFANLSVNPDILVEERKVVAEERRSRYENALHGAAFEQIQKLLFTNSTYVWPVIGWMKDIEKYNQNEVVNYHRMLYAPNNVVAVLTGDIQPAKALKWLRKYWGAIPPQPLPPKPDMAEPALRGERRLNFRFPAELPFMIYGYLIPPKPHRDNMALEMLGRILTNGRSSRLYRRLVLQERAVNHIDAMVIERLGHGSFQFFTTITQNSTIEAVEKIIQQELDRIISDGIEQEEMETTLNQFRLSFFSASESCENWAEWIGEAETDLGDYHKSLESVTHFESITRNDIIAAAKRYLHPDNRAVVIVQPEQKLTEVAA